MRSNKAIDEVTKHKRIRGRALQELRERFFRANPLCRICESKGKLTLATQLDHIEALHKGGANSDDNYQGLCEECHKAKTAIDKGYKQRKAIGIDGWPVED
jgi:5-methylcytosine-specific restriction protein A